MPQYTSKPKVDIFQELEHHLLFGQKLHSADVNNKKAALSGVREPLLSVGSGWPILVPAGR